MNKLAYSLTSAHLTENIIQVKRTNLQKYIRVINVFGILITIRIFY